MVFQKHVFISYAHIDNQPLSSEQEGWISRFHTSLESILSMRLGEDARIWRDDKLQGNDIFGDEIVQQFPKTALLVSVLTPRYVRSEWCTREVNEFYKVAQQTGGVVIDNKTRILKVIKTPVEQQDVLPPEVRGTLGYQFFTFDEQENPLELDPAFGQDLEQLYLRKLNSIAWDIVELLDKLHAQNGRAAPADVPADAAAPDKPVVYLAESSYDMREEREVIEGELKAHGYTVLPDQNLPRLETDYVAEVERLLARCKLSIHLVGESYGAVPDGPSQKSVVVLQNESAVQRSKAGGLHRLIWLPSDIASDQPLQQQFIASINRDAEVQFGADVITASLEDLKAAIHARLEQIEKPKPEQAEAQAVASDVGTMVYVICDERDRKATVPLRKFLKGQGFEVNIPLFSGDAASVREAQKAYLTDCDAIILFYGAGDEAWKFGKENELKKMRAYRGDKPLRASFTYLAEPSTDDKEEMIDFEEPNLIDGLAGFSEAAMDAFLQAVNQR